jgi:hypothetical protein
LHPSAADLRTQAPRISALRAGKSKKEADLEALASIGVDVSESALIQACSAAIEYSANLLLGQPEEEFAKSEEVGDEVGIMRARKHADEAKAKHDELRLNPNAVEVPLSRHERGEKRSDGRAGPVDWALEEGANPEGIPDDRFDALIRAKAIAAMLLMVADLSSEESAKYYLDKFNRFGADPSLEQLHAGRLLLETIESALMNGDPRVWRVVEDAAAAAKVRKEWIAIELLQEFIRTRNDIRQLRAYNDLRTKGGTIAAMTTTKLAPIADPVAEEEAAIRTIEKLSTAVDDRFREILPPRFIEIMEDVGSDEIARGRGNRSAFYGLAKLCVECGALDKNTKPGHGEKPTDVLTRLANDFSTAWRQTQKREHRRKTGQSRKRKRAK